MGNTAQILFLGLAALFGGLARGRDAVNYRAESKRCALRRFVAEGLGSADFARRRPGLNVLLGRGEFDSSRAPVVGRWRIFTTHFLRRLERNT
jgi:hypothetical protein